MIFVAKDGTLERRTIPRIRQNNGRYRSEMRIFVEEGPHFSIEESGKPNAYFLTKSNTNQLVGILRDGELQKSNLSIEKLHYLSKLDLIPKKSFLDAKGDTTCDELSVDDRSYFTCDSPPSDASIDECIKLKIQYINTE